MRATRYVIAVVLAAACTEACAGVTWLSRANCIAGVINESVTYDRPALKTRYMYTQSIHTGFGEVAAHSVNAPWNVTWRSYAGDTGDWNRNTVRGYHVYGDDMAHLTTRWTVTTDCNLTEW